MEINIELKELTPEEIKNAIKSEDENRFRDLIIEKYQEANEKNIKIKDFYYAYHVACSDEVFDMFSQRSIKNLFELYGYEVEVKNTENEEIIEIFVSKKDFVFKLIGVESMHDSLYAFFINTKEAEIVSN